MYRGKLAKSTARKSSHGRKEIMRLAFLAIAALFALALSTSTARAIDTEAEGFDVAHGATETVDAHGVCKEVTNNHASGQDIFVSTKTGGIGTPSGLLTSTQIIPFSSSAPPFCTTTLTITVSPGLKLDRFSPD